MEAQIEQLLNSVPDAMVLINQAGQIVFANSLAERLFGYARNELVGQPLEILIPSRFHPQHRQHITRYFAQPHARPMGIDLELYALRKDGREFPVEVSLGPLQTEAGFFVSSAIRDSTRRRKKTEELLQRATQLALINEIGSQITLELELAEVFSQTARLVQETFDYHHVALFLIEGEVLRLKAVAGSYQTYFSPDHIQHLNEGINGWVAGHGQKLVANDVSQESHYISLIAEHSITQAELCLPINIGGQTVGVLDIQSPRRNAFRQNDIMAMEALTHHIAAAIEIARLYEQAQQEIAERTRAEAKLQHRNRELTLLNQVIAASTAILIPEAFLEMVCRELALAFKMPQVTAALFNPEKSEIRVVAEYLAEKELSLMNVAFPVARNPLLRHILTHKAPLPITEPQNDPHLLPLQNLVEQRGTRALLLLPLLIEGEVTGVLGLEDTKPHSFSAQEVSLAWSVADQVAGALARAALVQERRQLEEQYYQAQKMEAIGQLTAGIAHDFNNLLTAINGFAELGRMQLSPEDPTQEMLDRILYSGQRAARLVSQLLAFSRKQIIEPQLLELNFVVAKMSKILERIIGENINLQTNFDSDLWLIKTDPSQIEQILVNLAVNARDAMPDGGKLTIETANVVLDENHVATHLETQPGEHVRLSISDTGLGMTEEVKAHLFEPFFTTKEQGKGTGLGLATVYGIVKQNGGNIWVYSEVGQGTTFKIYLPRAEEGRPPEVLPQSKTKIVGGNETILMVEDDIGVRELTRRMLDAQGYTVLVAKNGQTALELAGQQTGPIHLLLTDVVMPGITGTVLAEQLVQSRPELKVLFMSGYTDEAIARHGILEPGLFFLQKPFSPVTLARKVREALDS
jgi:PAS domain S-box-containing protein